MGAGQSSGFAMAHAALGRLQGTLKHLSNSDMVTRTLARREAVMSSRIEGTRSDLTHLLTYEATHAMTGLPADVRITERYVDALAHGLERVRVGGRDALDLDLIHELHAMLMQDEVTRFPVGAYRETRDCRGPAGAGRALEAGTSRLPDRFGHAPPAALPHRTSGAFGTAGRDGPAPVRACRERRAQQSAGRGHLERGD